jgi:hypothetical protein
MCKTNIQTPNEKMLKFYVCGWTEVVSENKISLISL